MHFFGDIIMKKVWITISIVFFVFGIILIAPIILSDEISFVYHGKILELSKLGTIGDYLSGTSGLLLSFAGLIFVYMTLRTQILQLKLQQDDTKSSKEQAEYEKLQSLIDNSSKRVSDTIENLFFQEIQGINPKYNDSKFLKGYSGISLMKSAIDIYMKSNESENSNEQSGDQNNLFIHLLTLLSTNYPQLNTIYNLTDDAINFIKISFATSTLKVDRINILKDSFYIYLGSDFIRMSDMFCLVYGAYLKMIDDKKLERPSLFDPIYQLHDKIKRFLSFKDEEFTEESLKSFKENIRYYRVDHHSMSGCVK
jgi:hypothetical protein